MFFSINCGYTSFGLLWVLAGNTYWTVLILEGTLKMHSQGLPGLPVRADLSSHKFAKVGWVREGLHWVLGVAPVVYPLSDASLPPQPMWV